MSFVASHLMRCLVLAALFNCLQAREFIDDRGVVFSWPDDASSPTIVANANGAIALFHLGFKQVSGVWDSWVIRGSDIDLNSNDLNSLFAADPNKLEVDFLNSVQNLSPTCHDDPNGCSREFDIGMLNELAPDFVVYMHHGPFAEITEQIVLSTGLPPIYIDERFENNEGCRTAADFETVDTNCYARSVLDVLHRTQELAEFFGVTASDKVANDQQIMCEAANEFALMAQDLHSRGVRCVGATARLNGGGNVNLVNLNQNPWLRTFEELGLPLLHPPLLNPTDFTRTYTVEDWFPGCSRFGSDVFNCEGHTPILPADCFLFDSRSFPSIKENKEEILSVISVEAIKEDQFSSFLLNDGAISYRTAAAVFKEVTEDLRNVQRIYDETACTSVEVASRDHTSLAFGGLSAAEYACLETTRMLTCPEGFTPGVSSSKEESHSNGGSDSSVDPSINGGTVFASSGTKLYLTTAATSLAGLALLG